VHDVNPENTRSHTKSKLHARTMTAQFGPRPAMIITTAEC